MNKNDMVIDHVIQFKQPFLQLPDSIKAILMSTSLSQFNSGIEIVLAALIIITMKSFLNKSWEIFRTRGASNNIKAILSGIGLGLCLLIACVIIAVPSNLFKYDVPGANQIILGKIALESPIIFLLMTCILAPFVEECIFRGIIFELLRKINIAIAMIGTAILFALTHIISNFGD